MTGLRPKTHSAACFYDNGCTFVYLRRCVRCAGRQTSFRRETRCASWMVCVCVVFFVWTIRVRGFKRAENAPYVSTDFRVVTTKARATNMGYPKRKPSLVVTSGLARATRTKNRQPSFTQRRPCQTVQNISLCHRALMMSPNPTLRASPPRSQTQVVLAIEVIEVRVRQDLLICANWMLLSSGKFPLIHRTYASEHHQDGQSPLHRR